MLNDYLLGIGICVAHILFTSAEQGGIIHRVAAVAGQYRMLVARFRCEVLIPCQCAVGLAAVEHICQLTALHLRHRHLCHAGWHCGTYLVDIIAS